MTDTIKPPFPWFGGKSRAANAIWARLGNVKNYVEPFAGSLAVLLLRPHQPHIETVNDIDCYLANFWRATICAPDEVAHWADWPVNEADKHARHIWLLGQSDFRQRMASDPDYYDAKIAGWWVWGQSLWIGTGWCDSKKYFESGQNPTRPKRGIPHIGSGGNGVHRISMSNLTEYFELLHNRLRKVRVVCGDWTRVLGKSPTYSRGMTGIVLDPPYAHDMRDKVYANDNNVAYDVQQWAIQNGDNPLLRIALCGYDSEHSVLQSVGWSMYRWSNHGGHGNKSNKRGKENAKRETIWFSPHCLPPDTSTSPAPLFD